MKYEIMLDICSNKKYDIMYTSQKLKINKTFNSLEDAEREIERIKKALKDIGLSVAFQLKVM